MWLTDGSSLPDVYRTMDMLQRLQDGKDTYEPLKDYCEFFFTHLEDVHDEDILLLTFVRHG
jgi:hypothetical protein